VLELCRDNLKKRDERRLERQQVLIRDRFLRFQVNKRQVLRRVAEDVLSTMVDVERETVASTRRSLFGDRESAGYEVLANRLIFPDSIADPFLRAEHYALFGAFDRDPDLYTRVAAVAKVFLQDMGVAKSDADAEGLLSVPDNAKMLMFSGLADESSRAKAQRAITSAWLTALEEAGIADYVVAAYEVVPILADYGAIVSPQQLKCALILKTELKRVEEILQTHDGRSMDKLHLAVQRVRTTGSTECMRYAARYLIDLSRFHRDVRKMQVLETVLESINLLNNERLRELSEINGTLYEYLLPEEEKPTESRVNDHVVLKADIRDSLKKLNEAVARWQSVLHTVASEPGFDVAQKEDRNEPMVFVNPQIVWESEGMAMFQEGCLSVPEIWDDVERHTAIRMDYLDRDGKPQTLEAEGLLADCLQHEIDHLNGTLFIDHLSRLKRAMAIKKLTKAKKREMA